MKNQKVRISFILIAILFAINPLVIFSQIKIHKHITQDDGLVNGQISAMMQDSKGYIWFATYDGVSKWDGRHFENFQTHNGLLSSTVTDIKEGPDGNIYMACYQGGILVYDNGVLDTISKKDGLISNVVTSIVVLQNGDVLFAATGDKITKLKNGKLSDWGKEVNYPNEALYTIRDAYQEKDGTLYLATQRGLIVYKNKTFKIFTTKDGLNHDLIMSVGGNGKGTIYTNSYKGINKIENGVISELTHKPGFNDAFCWRMIVAKDGTMYSATTKGIIIEKNGIVKTFTENNGLSFDYCMSVLEDNNGAIYFGTSGKGVSIYNPTESISNQNKSTGLPYESIWSILIAKDKTHYLGSAEGLIIKNEKGTTVLNKESGLVGDFIRVLKESNSNKILIGTSSGLSILENGKIENYTLENSVGVSRVLAISENDTGDIYLGTQNGIIIIRDGKEVKRESEIINKEIRKNLGGESIYSISKTKAGFVFGSLYGLVIYSQDELKFFSHKNGLVDNAANTTHVRDDGTILVGTLKGVNIIKNGEVVDTIDVSDGLSNNSIADIEEDNNGRIFISTFNGLNILTNIDDSLSITQLFKKDGLVGNDFTHEGTFLDDEGNLWLGTLYGITKYNPNLDKTITTPPELYLTGLQLFNKDYSLNKFLEKPEFNYEQNFIKFIFTGINLSSPEKIKYKYQLSGIDNNWVQTLNNSAPYTNLDAGNYTFKVKAQNEWGYWSKPVAVNFTITPAWYNTWWFYLLVILFVSALIAFVVSYRYRHLLALERIRSKISADLHDSIGSGLTEITFISEILKPQIADNISAIEGVKNITKISRKLVNDMRDIVWFINPSEVSLKDLFLRLQDSYQETLKFSEVNIFVNNIEKLDSIKLSIALRQHIFLIFKEAINNAIKYSKCSEIIVNVETKGKNLKISCIDDGIGFDMNNIKLGNGMKNMERRAKLANGNFAIESRKDGGTQIIFSGKFGKLNI